jgi:hypothetical protein
VPTTHRSSDHRGPDDHAADLAERARSLGKGGAGGQYIIYQHDLSIGDQLNQPRWHYQGPGQVPPSLVGGQPGLVDHAA